MRFIVGTAACLIIFLSGLKAQDLDGVIFENYTYQENIRSVTFKVENFFLSLPVITLGAELALTMEFDDLNADVKNYTYTFVHCDQFWKPSALTQLEYIDGYSDDRIINYSFSFKTLKAYTHYELRLPDPKMKWTKSGNYLLIVYDDENGGLPVISRRFVVVDPLQLTVEGKVVNPAIVSKNRTHHELDFLINYKQLPIRSPQQEIRTTILQNGRWDNALIGITPNFVRNNSNTVVFDYQDKIVFPAGKEYRYADLRSFRQLGPNIGEIELSDQYYEVYMVPEILRNNQSYFNRKDANGQFVIETEDQADWNLSAEYGYVRFFLKTQEPLEQEDVYLFGAMSDWQLQPEFKMEYNEAINAYVGMVLLKQGYYEYEYVTVPKNRKKNQAPVISREHTEGNWSETENQYTILIYYRPFGERYDQVIGSYQVSSGN